MSTTREAYLQQSASTLESIAPTDTQQFVSLVNGAFIEGVTLSPEAIADSLPQEANSLRELFGHPQFAGRLALNLYQQAFDCLTPGYKLGFWRSPLLQADDKLHLAQHETYWQEAIRTNSLPEPRDTTPVFANADDAIVQALLSPLNDVFGGPESVATRLGDAWIIDKSVAKILQHKAGEIQGYVVPIKLSETHPLSLDADGRRLSAEHYLRGLVRKQLSIGVGVQDLPLEITVVDAERRTSPKTMSTFANLSTPLQKSISIDNELPSDGYGRRVNEGLRAPRYKIREPNPEDFAQVLATFLESFRYGNPNEDLGITPQAVDHFMRETAIAWRKRGYFKDKVEAGDVLAVYDGEVVVGVSTFGRSPESLAVIKGLWRRGVARTLFDAVTERAYEKYRSPEMSFFTTEGSTPEAIYQQLGWQRTGRTTSSPPWAGPVLQVEYMKNL